MLPTIAMLGFELAKLAVPWLAEKAAGPKGGEIAEVLVRAAEQVTGKTGGDALAALKADPNLLLQYQSKLLTEDTSRLVAILGDVQDARARDVELRKLGHGNSRANWMIAGDVVGLLACVVTLLVLPEAWGTTKIPDVVWATLGGLITHFALCLRDAHQFEFGSSRSSQEKTEMLARR